MNLKFLAEPIIIVSDKDPLYLELDSIEKYTFDENLQRIIDDNSTTFIKEQAIYKLFDEYTKKITDIEELPNYDNYFNKSSEILRIIKGKINNDTLIDKYLTNLSKLTFIPKEFQEKAENLLKEKIFQGSISIKLLQEIKLKPTTPT